MATKPPAAPEMPEVVRTVEMSASDRLKVVAGADAVRLYRPGVHMLTFTGDDAPARGAAAAEDLAVNGAVVSGYVVEPDGTTRFRYSPGHDNTEA